MSFVRWVSSTVLCCHGLTSLTEFITDKTFQGISLLVERRADLIHRARVVEALPPKKKLINDFLAVANVGELVKNDASLLKFLRQLCCIQKQLIKLGSLHLIRGLVLLQFLIDQKEELIEELLRDIFLLSVAMHLLLLLE